MRPLLSILAAATLAGGGAAYAQEPFAGLQKNCAACHAISRPAAPAGGIDRIWNRKAPDLFYAGRKFRREWLVSWLQDPSPVRPGGVFYRRFAKTSPSGADVVPPNALPPHPRLAKADAEKAADALMALTDDGGALEAGLYKGGTPNVRFGKLGFTKLRGCGGCHRYTPKKGGVSGPELHTAGDRLQADYIASYIVNPQGFDAGVWMPKLDLSEQDVQRLTGYLLSLHGEKQ